jgi:hypothetical protein
MHYMSRGKRIAWVSAAAVVSVLLVGQAPASASMTGDRSPTCGSVVQPSRHIPLSLVPQLASPTVRPGRLFAGKLLVEVRAGGPYRFCTGVYLRAVIVNRRHRVLAIDSRRTVASAVCGLVGQGRDTPLAFSGSTSSCEGGGPLRAGKYTLLVPDVDVGPSGPYVSQPIPIHIVK